jgi:hypothetical protein
MQWSRHHIHCLVFVVVSPVLSSFLSPTIKKFKAQRTFCQAIKSMFEKSSFMRGKKQSISPFQDQPPKQQKT